MKTLGLLAVGALIAGSTMAGTVQQNLGFEPGSTFIEQDIVAGASTAWNYATNNRVVLGQSFSLTNETTLRAITLVKNATYTYSGGTNDLTLWVGQYATNGIVTSTNLLETFDLEGITLTNNNYFSLNMDADLVLPAGDYVFQFWPEEREGGTLAVKTAGADSYSDGTMMRWKDPATIPADGGAFDGDLTFGLHSAVVGVVSNVAPNADDQDVSTQPNVGLSLVLTGSDPDGETNLLYTVVDSPTNGVLSGIAPDLIYTPNNDFQGLDSFTFTVNDGVYSSEAATVSITVTNVPPVASDQSVSTLQNSLLAITLTGNDPEGSNLTYVVVDTPTNGVLNGTAPDLTYTPNNGFTGDDRFTFTVNDGVHDSEVGTVSIAVIPQGTIVSFSGLSADLSLSSNLLNVAGSTTGLDLSGISTNGDYVYSISYAGADLDGDEVNDTLSFDVRVSGTSGAAYTFSTTPGASAATIGTGSLNVFDGTGLPYQYNPSQKAWCVRSSATGMLGGDTLAFTVENVSLTASAGPADGLFIGFDGVVLAERAGSAHQTILGSGSGLDGYEWDNSFSVTNFTMNPLHVTQATTSGAGLRYGVSTVDLTFSISSAAPPTSVGDISSELISGGTQIALSWPTKAGFHYGVKATDDLVFGTWTNVVTGILASGSELSVTNDITEDQLFYRSFLDE